MSFSNNSSPTFSKIFNYKVKKIQRVSQFQLAGPETACLQVQTGDRWLDRPHGGAIT